MRISDWSSDVCSSDLAISIFFGSQPRNAHVPPKGRLSKLATRQPALAVIRATPFPPVPPPITIRSKLFVSLILSSSGPSPVLAKAYLSDITPPASVRVLLGSIDSIDAVISTVGYCEHECVLKMTEPQ